MAKWWLHPIELWLRYWRGYDEPDWRTRLLKPFLQIAKDPTLVTFEVDGVLESWEYKWEQREWTGKGWEDAGIHPVHDMKGRKAKLVRRRLK